MVPSYFYVFRCVVIKVGGTVLSVSILPIRPSLRLARNTIPRLANDLVALRISTGESLGEPSRSVISLSVRPVDSSSRSTIRSGSVFICHAACTHVISGALRRIARSLARTLVSVTNVRISWWPAFLIIIRRRTALSISSGPLHADVIGSFVQ